jgi:hypothetical protein
VGLAVKYEQKIMVTDTWRPRQTLLWMEAR